MGKTLNDADEIEEEKQLEDVYDEIYNEMLDDIFGESNQRLMRSEFIDKLTSAGRKYLSPNEIKKVVDKKLKEKNI